MTQKYLDALELLASRKPQEFIAAVRTKCLDVELPFARPGFPNRPDMTLFRAACIQAEFGECILALLPLVNSISAEELACVYGKTRDAISKRFLTRFVELNGGKFPETGKVFSSTELVEGKGEPWTTMSIWEALRHYNWSYKLARTCVETYGMPLNLVVSVETFRRGVKAHIKTVIALAGANPTAPLSEKRLSVYLLSAYTNEALGVTSDNALSALARWRKTDAWFASMCCADGKTDRLQRARVECMFWELVEASEGNPALPGTLADLLAHAADALNTDVHSNQYSGALFVARMAITAGASPNHIKEELRGYLPNDLRFAADQMYTAEKQCDTCCGKGKLPPTYSELGFATKRARIDNANRVLDEEFDLFDDSD